MAGQQPTMRTGTPDDPPPARVVVVDNQHFVRERTSGYLAREPAFEVVGGAATGAQGIAVCRRLRPDLVVLDVDLPDMSGIDVATALRALPQSPLILMQSGTRDPYIVWGALQAGARGYVDKAAAPGELVSALQAVLRGESPVLRGVTLPAHGDGG